MLEDTEILPGPLDTPTIPTPFEPPMIDPPPIDPPVIDPPTGPLIGPPPIGLLIDPPAPPTTSHWRSHGAFNLTSKFLKLWPSIGISAISHLVPTKLLFPTTVFYNP